MKSMFNAAISIGLALLVAGCADPYEKELPASGFVSAGEAERIAEKLNDADKDLFRRWSKRAPTNERFPGEGIPHNVRNALMNQTRFEALQAEASAKEAERIAQEKNAAEELERSQAQQRAVYEQMKEADEIIKNYFVASPASYDLVPIFNSYGALSHREWQFDFRFTNKTPKTIIGISGLALVKDAFGEEIDMYDFRVEPIIEPGKTISYTMTMRHDPKDPGHVAMINTQTLFFEWLFNSLAFGDGTKLDHNAVASEALNDSTRLEAAWP
jgi:hypothetical protein